jgi:Fur family ferric uptake transcriptional regulator
MVAEIRSISKLLHDYGLSETSIRREVLNLLWGDGVAYTQKELEEQLPGNPDRVTLYRTLKLFSEKKIVHKIVIDGEISKYKLARHFLSSDHAHFYCIRCRKLLCMPQLDVNCEKLPAGFSFQSVRLVVEGICDQCSI